MPPAYVLAALALLRLVSADYYIDNANNTVAYAASGTDWRTFSFATQNLTFDINNENVTVDSSKCYDQNYALAACTAEQNCQITFPFTGSGVTVYILHAGFQGITASLTIDGGQTVTTSLPAPDPPTYQTPNVSLFSVQSLTTADHTATINLLDSADNGTTSLYFDYALVNESLVDESVPSTTSTSTTPTTASTATSSVATSQPSPTTQPTSASTPLVSALSTLVGSTSTPASSSSTASNPGSSLNLGTVIGGACGGLAALIAIVTAIIFLKNRKSSHAKLEDSRRPVPFPATAPQARDPMVSLPGYSVMDSKARMRLAARDDAMLNQSRGQSAGESSDFHIRLTGDAGRAPESETRSSGVDPFSNDDFVIDCRREDGSPPNLRGSVAPTLTPTIPPPSYQTE